MEIFGGTAGGVYAVLVTDGAGTVIDNIDGLQLVDDMVVLGDSNLDGKVDGLDVDPFVSSLLNGPYQIQSDMNQDGAVDAWTSIRSLLRWLVAVRRLSPNRPRSCSFSQH